MEKNSRILVTGGAGFVGSNLVKKLCNLGYKNIQVLDDLFTGDILSIQHLPINFVEGTVENNDLVQKLVSESDIVFHLAARNIIVSNSNSREDMNVNVVGSFNVFEAALKHKIKKVVYTSTASVYGNNPQLPIAEDDKKQFLSFYSASKFSAEVYAKAFFEVNQLPVNIVRYSNVYGPGQSTKNPYCGVIGKFINASLQNETISIHGDGEQTRDFSYIDDAVQGTILAATSTINGQIYNLGTGIETSVLQLAEQIKQLTNSVSHIQHIDKRDIDNIRRRAVNIEKARYELQYQPMIPLKNGLTQTIDWRKTQLHEEN